MSGGLWGDFQAATPWHQQPDLHRRQQQRTLARARNLATWRDVLVAQPDNLHHRTLTMNQTIERLNHRLADLQVQRTNVASHARDAITRAEAHERECYQALLDAIADGRDETQERRAHETALAALQDAQLQADVGKVRATRLQADIRETEQQIEQATEEQRLRTIAALERARDELERDLVELTERRFEAEARGLQINARLHQLRGLPAPAPATVPPPYGYPVFRPITLGNPAPQPVFPSLHRLDSLARIGAEVAQIGSEL